MLAFVHILKTAGTTLDDILARSYGLRHCYLPTSRGRRLSQRKTTHVFSDCARR